MYQALYRKYRPKSFASVVSQDVVKKILINSIKNHKISHAYLFSGPRGIGKTSIAKIFAKAVNCLDFDKNDDVCLECANCREALNSVDIIEIDAASNNGVSEIRELKSKVNVVPTNLKYKVYIIDEVHMLSNSAFNALLKTLEEPPSHVIFILATTEFYAVPETIVSRCQCFNFDRITNDDLVKRLRFICEEEKIEVSDEVLLLIATTAEGGLRDAISMLDKLAVFSNNTITMDDFIQLNGLVSFQDVEKSYNLLISGEYSKLLEIVDKINTNGYSFTNFIERLMIYVKDLILKNYNNNVSEFSLNKHITLVNKLNNLLTTLTKTLNPLIMVQIGFLEIIEGFNELSSVSHETPEKAPKTPVKKALNTISKDVSREKFSIDENIKKIRINNALAKASLAFKKELIKYWPKILSYRLEDKFARAIQFLNNATPSVVSDEYVIITSDSEAIIFQMYEVLSDIEDLLEEVCNRKYRVVFVTNKEFEKIKKQYINDKKNGIIYEYQVEQKDLIVKKIDSDNKLLAKAIEVFGSDLVELEEK